MRNVLSRRVAALILSAVGVLSAVLVTPPPALAHNSLAGSSPKDGARLAKAPPSVRLTFLSRVDPATTDVTVTGPDGASAAAGEPDFAGSRVTVPLRAGPAGRYAIGYEILSGDGHPIRGTVTFTLTTAAASTAPAASAPAAPSTTPPTTPPAGSPPAARPAERVADERGTPWWPWALGGVAALVLVGGGAFLVGRRT